MNKILPQALRAVFVFLVSVMPSFAFAFVIAPEPSSPTSSITATAGACNEINLNFMPGDGSRRLIVGSIGAPVSVFPVDATSYTGGSICGTGTNLGNGNFVLYNGSGSSSTISGLDGGTEYFFASFEFNGVGTNSNYLIIGYPEANEIAPGISMTVLSSSGDICIGDSVQLQASGALTYIWTPALTLSNDTASIVIAKPVSTTIYTVTGTDGGGCQDSRTLNIIVNQLPLVTLSSFQAICINEGVIVLSGGNPAGGEYFGNGISTGVLDPTIPGPGNSDIFYTYTDIHGCIDTATRSIQIKNSPTVTLSTFNSVCIDGSPFTLSGGSPTGGDYSGTGVNANDVFNPANAGVGSHVITYIYTNQGCSDTAVSPLAVNALPVVSFANLSAVCFNTPAYTLSGGTPVGGTYSGTAVSGNEFNPATSGVGNFMITYNYVNANGCAASDTSVVRVNSLPTVSFSTLPTVCQNTGPVALTQGSPAGGTYSGTGVGGTTFYTGIAGAGTHNLVYTYHDSNNCSNSATQSILVNPIPTVNLGPDTTICSDVSIVLNGGTFSLYNWSNGANTPSIAIDSTGRGLGTFRFILIASNSFSCVNRDTVFVTIDPCTGIEENKIASFSTYPNPFTSNLVVKMNSVFELSVYDISGRLILEKKNLFTEVEFGDELKKGTYLLRVKTPQGEASTILIKE